MSVEGGPDIVTDGLLVNVDAANIRSFASGSTTWLDLSKNGRNGTLINGPAFSSANGGILVFDGTNDYITFGNTLGVQGDPFTHNILFYLNSFTTSTANQGVVVYFRGPFNSTGYYFQLPTSQDGVGYFLSNGSSVQTTTTTALWRTGNWYDLCVTRSGASVRIYVNGVDVTNVAGNHTSIFLGGESFIIGAYSSTSPFIFNSNRVAFFKAYNRALSAREVRQNYHATKGRVGL